MKKLMMAAAIVCAAAVANAASADWGTGTMYYGGVGTKVGDSTKTQLDDGDYTGYGYCWVLGLSTDATVAADYASLTTASQILTLAQASEFDSITINGHEYSLTDAFETSGGELTFMDTAEYSDGQKAYAVVLVQAKDGEGNVVAYSANAVEGVFDTSGGGNLSMALNWGAEGKGTATTWQAVPEPTSGLLLLLGVAGLALRRRRA